MRILHTADWHVGATLRGRSRADEHRAVLAEVVSIAEERQVDLAIVAGDLFHHAAPNPESEQIVYDALLRLARDGRQVLLVAGNHDNPARVEAIRPLLGMAGIHAVGHPRRRDEGGIVRTETRNGERANAVLLPFLSQRGIVKADDLMSGQAGDHVQKYADRIRSILSHLCEGFEEDAVNLVISHLTVVGGKVGGGEREAHTVFDYQVPPQVFPTNAHYTALGHLHRSQEVPGPGKIHYSGAPIQVDFSEEKNDPCVLLAEAEAGVPARVTEEKLRSPRSLRTLSGTREELMEERDSAGDAYLRIEVEERPTPGLADEMREVFPNAVDVRVVHEAEEQDSRPPIDMGKSPGGLFRQFLEEHGLENEDLLKLFDELLEEEFGSEDGDNDEEEGKQDADPQEDEEEGPE